MSIPLEPAGAAVAEIELTQLDLRYEGYRLVQPDLEKRLLATIAGEGIREPLQGVREGTVRILLDGFKRLRAARKLNLHTVPFGCLGTDEVGGILELLRQGQRSSLAPLEQARFVQELHRTRGLSVAEIAEQLSRSKAWVTLRLELLAGLSATVSQALFAGAFPVYSYLYSLRPFRRLKSVSSTEVDQFVDALRDRKLSVRQIEGLAHGFFRGPPAFRQQILQGNLALALNQLTQAPPDPEGCSDAERVLLQDLESVHKFMLRVLSKGKDPRLASRPFWAQCNLLSAAVLSRTQAFLTLLKDLHDRSGQA